MSASRSRRWARIASAVAMALAATASRAQEPNAAPEVPGPELLLTLSLELSTENHDNTAIVGTAVRTEISVPGDRLEISQRISRLRKELGIKYIAPTERLGFQLASNEINVAETRRYITETQLLTTAQAAYRFYWSRISSVGLWGIGWGAEALRLDTDPTSAPYLSEFVQRYGKSSHNLPLLAFWSYDRRRADSILPEGHLDRVNAEWGTGLGNLAYVKGEYQHSSYWTFGPQFAAGFNGSIGAIHGLHGDLTPLAKRYFGGGVGTVRGYEASALTPTDIARTGMGANRQALASAEALWHAFSIGETPVILSTFVDWGKFWDTGTSQVADETRVSASSYGLGVSMPVRIGLVRFYFAKPLDNDRRTQRFQFDARANWR